MEVSMKNQSTLFLFFMIAMLQSTSIMRGMDSIRSASANVEAASANLGRGAGAQVKLGAYSLAIGLSRAAQELPKAAENLPKAAGEIGNAFVHGTGNISGGFVHGAEKISDAFVQGAGNLSLAAEIVVPALVAATQNLAQGFEAGAGALPAAAEHLARGAQVLPQTAQNLAEGFQGGTQNIKDVAPDLGRNIGLGTVDRIGEGFTALSESQVPLILAVGVASYGLYRGYRYLNPTEVEKLATIEAREKRKLFESKEAFAQCIQKWPARSGHIPQGCQEEALQLSLQELKFSQNAVLADEMFDQFQRFRQK